VMYVPPHGTVPVAVEGGGIVRVSA
jgi:hypothetical protein